MSSHSEIELRHLLLAEEGFAESAGRQDCIQAVTYLDPKRVAPNAFSTHVARTFNGPEFRRFKEQIQATCGNVVPIMVTPTSGRPDYDYEIVYGRRRHQACLEIGLRVLAFVYQLPEATNTQILRIVENSGHRRASPYEQGKLLRAVRESGSFKSDREAATFVGLSHSSVSKLIKLAQLPGEIVDAFNCPSDLQVNWAAPLHDALAHDREGIQRRALHAKGAGWKPKQVFEFLIGATGQHGRTREVIHVFREDELVAIVRLPFGTAYAQATIEVSPTSIEELVNALQRLPELSPMAGQAV